MSLLILGGTGDARKLAGILFNRGLSVTYSVAGLVRKPHVPCEIISGGFSQFATSQNNGLQNYIKQNDISAIVDVTHPYAKNMSRAAVISAEQCHIPYWRFHRTEWKIQRGDNWKYYKRIKDLLPELRNMRNIFFSVGQVDKNIFETLNRSVNGKEQTYFLRTAIKPNFELEKNVKWIKAIGPFQFKDELVLIERNEIDVIVTKNSGGVSTVAKIEVARKLGIPVLMLTRPVLPKATNEFLELESCIECIANFYKTYNQRRMK